MATTRRGKMRSQKQKASWRRRSEEHVGRKAIGAMATALGASPIGRQTEFFIFLKTFTIWRRTSLTPFRRQIKHLVFIFFQILGDGYPGRLGVAYFLFLVCFLFNNLATGMLRSPLVAIFLNLNITIAMVCLSLFHPRFVAMLFYK